MFVFEVAHTRLVLDTGMTAAAAITADVAAPLRVHLLLKCFKVHFTKEGVKFGQGGASRRPVSPHRAAGAAAH